MISILKEVHCSGNVLVQETVDAEFMNILDLPRLTKF